MVPFEEINKEAGTLLLRIEVVLRELLAREYRAQHGIEWQRRIPGALLAKIRASQVAETRPQYDFLRLGPFYYLTFGELLESLKQGPGRELTRKLGGDTIIGKLEGLLAPRNAIAHSRSVSQVGLKAAQALYAEIATAVGPDRFVELAARPQAGVYPDEVRPVVCRWLLEIRKSVVEFTPLSSNDRFADAQAQYWWPDEPMAGFCTSAIDEIAEAVDKLRAVTDGIGSAAPRLQIIRETDLRAKIDAALNDLGCCE